MAASIRFAPPTTDTIPSSEDSLSQSISVAQVGATCMWETGAWAECVCGDHDGGIEEKNTTMRMGTKIGLNFSTGDVANRQA